MKTKLNSIFKEFNRFHGMGSIKTAMGYLPEMIKHLVEEIESLEKRIEVLEGKKPETPFQAVADFFNTATPITTETKLSVVEKDDERSETDERSGEDESSSLTDDKLEKRSRAKKKTSE